MEVPYQYPYNPRLWSILALFGVGLSWIAVPWFLPGHIPDGLSLWFGPISIVLALIVGVRRIWFERYLLLDSESMVLPTGLFQIRTANVEYSSIKHVRRHLTLSLNVVLRVETEKRNFEIVSALLPDNKSFCALEEFLARKARKNTGRRSIL